ncbi:MAG: tryptophan 2,3-dioxygenase [Bacteroidetes bacterium]|nr:tryptophan 2,3-dioxygenase [Bacteroidota bacterium]
MDHEEIIQAIDAKYKALGENPDAYLEGLLHAKPITYWDYIGVDTLLTLQKPRTDYADEVVFIMYHQVTELVLKMILHEIRQMVHEPFQEAMWLDKLDRLKRYTSLLITSFGIMRSGMNYDDYSAFRNTLTPASGFQSAQFRYIEIHCTRLENLVNEEGKKQLSANPSTEEYFEHIYWKDAGVDRTTGEKRYTLRQFEEKYLDSFVALADKLKGTTLEEIVLNLESCSPALKEKLKEFDHLYNVVWPLTHLQTAGHYLEPDGVPKVATGGSEWKKYLHPKFQERKFFPTLWGDDELAHWGEGEVS